MNIDPAFVGVVISALAVLAWTFLLIRTVAIYGLEKRKLWLAMPIAGLIASVGTLASAWGPFAATHALAVDVRVLQLVSGMGRGALLIAALAAWAMYHPGRSKE